MLTRIFKEFFESEKAGGIVLIICTALSIFLVNSQFHDFYIGVWETQFAGHDIPHWINDGLMAIFFFMIGLELVREVKKGELSDVKKSLLPIVGALGGMVIPASVYLAFNYGTATQSGAGIPMATDIAFALGILSLLGSRVPNALKIFLTALAVIDDLGAIIVIAIFYTDSINALNLFIALAIFGGLLGLNKLKIHNLIPYLVGGVFMWYFMLHSGIHATIAGVLLAITIPFAEGNKKGPNYKLLHALHKPVAFFILPLFALANTAITIDPDWKNIFTQLSDIGIMAGLFLGKPLGIMLFCYIAIRLDLCKLPRGVKWKHLLGVGYLGGIGFTMSIFITLLAFNDATLINYAKLSILIASLLSGVKGFIWLKFTLKEKKTDNTNKPSRFKYSRKLKKLQHVG